MKTPVFNILLVIELLFAVSSFAQSRNAGLTKFVNPFIGTGAADQSSLSGSNFPGATIPFGFVQLSPDTDDKPFNPASGYDYQHKTIVGFSHTHLSGTGVADLFDVLMMPISGEVKTIPGDPNKARSGYRSAFSHEQELARPGYYQVKLLDYDINAELTATEHSGFHRYTFAKGKDAHVLVDMNHSLSKNRNYWVCRILGAQLRVVNSTTLEGYRVLTGWARMRKVYFRAEFSKPFKRTTMVQGQRKYENTDLINGTDIKAILDFDNEDETPLLVKVGLSPVSIENAAENLKQEIKDWNFDGIAKAADALWEKELSTFTIDGTSEQKQIFYTGLYHAFIQPNNVADVNGQYQASDMTIKTAPDKSHFSTFSLWDTYRAAHPLYTFVQQKRTAGFVNSMIRQYETYGYLPIWQLWSDENYCMIGNHSIPVIVDAALKGIKGFDINKAYEAVKLSSERIHPGSPFDLWEKYKYMPENLQSQSVSITLEMAYNDWCVALLAKHLGKMSDYNKFMARSQNFANVYDKESGFFRGKNSDGTWVSPFDPLQYGGNGGNPYTEGNAWQYFWYVPQDVPSLIRLVGNEKLFNKKLDTFFTTYDKPGEKNENASGFIGQYAHGNEPSHHVAYLYNYSGQPWKAQMYISKVLNEQYNNKSDGYSGNEDCGQMSAWYIFSSMGIYPVNPANGIYAIGSPILPKAVMHLPNGKNFTVITRNASGKNPYIQSLKLNGKAYDKTYISYQDIMNGATLEFTMGPKPNNNWGVKPSSRPPLSGF